MKTKGRKAPLTLGCGLIRIGRTWGVDSKPIPTDREARLFLEGAFELGIRFFDTAPSYGLSELRLGEFLKSLTAEQRKEVVIATKFGEHWDFKKQEPYADHSYEVMRSSLHQSLKILGKIDILQLHKASIDLLKSNDIDRIFALGSDLGISFFGASISDIGTGMEACRNQRVSYIQLPYNEQRTELLPVIKQAKIYQKKVLFNRPFAMGALAKLSSDKARASQRMIAAYQRIADLDCSGVVLTGTASLEHLKQNIFYFESAIYD